MAKKIAIHSYRGGTGKSNIAANLSAQLASRGKRVGAIDTDIQSPGINVLFGREETGAKTLNEYLWGTCSIEEAAIDITEEAGVAPPGKLVLMPSSFEAHFLAGRLLAERGFDPGPADGIWGPATRRALTDFEASAGRVADGYPDPGTLAALLGGTVPES